MDKDGRLLLRVGEAAEALGLSRGAVYSLILEGSLPSLKIGRSRRIVASALDAWVNDRVDEQAREAGLTGTTKARADDR